jgi:transposase
MKLHIGVDSQSGVRRRVGIAATTGGNMAIVRVGLDIAKSVFQVHGVDAHGKATMKKTLSRKEVLEFFATLPPCLVGIEACASAHYWARELSRFGHDVRLMAAQFVIPYRKSGKNDANDAEAICEAVAGGMAKLRMAIIEIRVGKRTMALLSMITIGELYERMLSLQEKATEYERKISELARQSEAVRRLMKIEGVGPITATAVLASVGDAKIIRNGREFAAWLGLTPRQHSSGGKNRLGEITKRGDVRLRTLLVHGTRSTMRFLTERTDRRSRWVCALQKRSCSNVAAVALAAKNARVMWAMLAHGTEYKAAA